jgi:DNA-binding transcriptional ArsR family regulator
MSHHFSVLKEADLIRFRREGQLIWYSVNTTVLQDVLTWTMDLLHSAENKERKTPCPGNITSSA